MESVAEIWKERQDGEEIRWTTEENETLEKERKYFEREKVYKSYSDEKESNRKKLKGNDTIKVVIN